MDNWKLAWEIFAELKENGADIGNASVFIIHPVLEKHNPARNLTTDAPTGTVTDSGSVSKHSTDDTCPFCKGSGLDEEPEKYGDACIWCDGTGKVNPVTKKNRVPSVTPSSR